MLELYALTFIVDNSNSILFPLAGSDLWRKSVCANNEASLFSAHISILSIRPKPSMNNTSTELLPVKGKKKKISFLQDDDFFVIKKNKKTKTSATATRVNEASTPPLTKSSDTSQPASELPSTDNLDSDDLFQSFHSARESFSVEEPPSEAAKNVNHKTNPQAVQGAPDEVQTISDDDIDDFDVDLNTFFKGIKKSQAGTTKSGAGESTRIYIIKIISKYGMSLESEIAVSGDTTFGSILDDLDTGDKQFPLLGANGVLLWVEGKSELKRFFKPSTLRIPEPANGASTSMTVLYVPPEHAKGLESIYAEFQKIGGADEQSVIELLDTSGTEETRDRVENTSVIKPNYFVIGIKGKDNKRIECEVGPETKIRSLLDYYMKVKGISNSELQHPKLVFDDEELDLEGFVRDTELEDEFEVQVYI